MRPLTPDQQPLPLTAIRERHYYSKPPFGCGQGGYGHPFTGNGSGFGNAEDTHPMPYPFNFGDGDLYGDGDGGCITSVTVNCL